PADPHERCRCCASTCAAGWLWLWRRCNRRRRRSGRTAAAVAATSPNVGWGGSPYHTGTGYYGGGRYYGGGAFGARAAYYGGYPSAAGGGVSSSDYDLYIRNLHDAGYDPKNNFNANGTIKTQ